MIRWGTMVRVMGEKGLWFVHDFDEDLSGNLDDPACVRCVEKFDPRVPYEEWVREEHFHGELEEVSEAEGMARQSSCPDFEYIIISNFWTEDTPPERHYSIWVIRDGAMASVWLKRGYFEDIEEVGTLSEGKVSLLRKAFDEVGMRSWSKQYSHEGWYIGSNAWEIVLVQDTCKVTVGGDDGYDLRLGSLCKCMRAIGIPVKFRKGHGLVYDAPRKKSCK